jgi:stage III sporulation protein AF
MIEALKVWISTLLCIGIFITILEVILPNNKFKKYIYTLIGIITTITIVAPGLDILNKKDVALSVSTTLDNINTNIESENLVEKHFVTTLKKDIETKLTLKGVNIVSIDVLLTKDYNISKLSIKTKKLSSDMLSNINQIVDYINKEYDIDYSKIEVVESGG